MEEFPPFKGWIIFHCINIPQFLSPLTNCQTFRIFPICFIDYAKAFDSVNHNKLWKILKEMGIQTTWPPSWETCMQVRKQQLELDMGQQTSSIPFPVDHILSDCSTMTRPSWVAPHAWLSFIELDKAVVLWSDWLVFCNYGFSLSALWCPLATPTILLGFFLPWTWGSLHGCPSKEQHSSLPWMRGISSWPPLLTLNVEQLLSVLLCRRSCCSLDVACSSWACCFMFSCCFMNSMKRQNDKTLKEELPKSKVPDMLLEISGEITPERVKRWSQCKNNTQLWMWLVIEARSDAVKSNIT